MRKQSRKLVNLLKRLMKRLRFDETAVRMTWMRKTGRSRARYYVWAKVALAELEQEALKDRQTASTQRSWPLPAKRDNRKPKGYPGN